MLVSEISLWGASIVAFFVIVASIALTFLDGKMLWRMLVIFGATVAQMACMTASMIQTMVNYQRSLYNPEAYKQTLHESILLWK